MRITQPTRRQWMTALAASMAGAALPALARAAAPQTAV